MIQEDFDVFWDEISKEQLDMLTICKIPLCGILNITRQLCKNLREIFVHFYKQLNGSTDYLV